MMKVILLILISWLIPASGYWFLGRRWKAIGIFGLISLLILAGILLADFRDVRYRDNPFYYLGRFGCGLGWLIINTCLSYTPAGVISPYYFDIGQLYLCLAGVLNLVVVLNLPFGSAQKPKEPQAPNLPLSPTKEHG